jgi:hypothetical protein
MVTFGVFAWCLLVGIGLLAAFAWIFCAMTCHYVWCIRELLERGLAPARFEADRVGHRTPPMRVPDAGRVLDI